MTAQRHGHMNEAFHALRCAAGFAGNLETAYTFPTVTQTAASAAQHGLHALVTTSQTQSASTIARPVHRGNVVDWQEFEKLLFDCFYKCASSCPTSQCMLATEMHQVHHLAANVW